MWNDTEKEQTVQLYGHDHDLLITVSADVKNLVTKVSSLESTVLGLASCLPLAAEATNAKLERKVDWGKFWGILILLVGLTVGTIGYNFQLDQTAHAIATRNETKLDIWTKDKGVTTDVDGNIESGK